MVGPYSPFDEPGVLLPTYALFNVSGAEQLTGKQRIEDSAEVCSQGVLDEFRVKLGVVQNFDRTRSREQIA